MLDSLEKEYKREEDPCSSGGLDIKGEKSSNSDRRSAVNQLINKHGEQKEAFLKGE